MQVKMQSLVKLIFLALVFGSLVGCGDDDDNSSNSSVGTQSGNNSTNNSIGGTGLPVPQVVTIAPKLSNIIIDVDDASSSGFPKAPHHIFGWLWDSPSIKTHTLTYSGLGYEDQLLYKDEVEDEFPDVLQVGHSGVYHNVAYYKGNFIGDASVAITDQGLGVYSVIQAVDLVLPLPNLFPIDAGIFNDGTIFPELADFSVTKVGTTIHYGYFGSPNFQTYKEILQGAGFAPADGRSSSNVWVKEVKVAEVNVTTVSASGDTIIETTPEHTLVYTFEHDNPLLNTNLIPILSDLPIPSIAGATTVGGWVNHWVSNWTNLNKYGKWTVSLKQ
ncbi:MAG: hypothetical protein LBS39_02890 [Campylobacteraceae bacterium]|jgi:hypothetical protein|nr:hypothetical protein [Campylobacteraceae bacterium]